MNTGGTPTHIAGLDCVNRDEDARRSAAPNDATISIFVLSLTRTHSLQHPESLVTRQDSRRPPAPSLGPFANPLPVKLAGGDWEYRVNMQRMSLVFCDGIALTWAARRIGGYPIERISFDSTSIAPSVFRIAEQNE